MMKKKTYFVEIRSAYEMSKKRQEIVRFIGNLDECIEVKSLDAKMQRSLSKVWKEKMKTTRKMPKYLVAFQREVGIEWSSVEKFYLPVRFISRSATRVEENREGKMWKLLTGHTFADVVKEIPEASVEQEVEKWKMLTEL
jgi:hypothetical protein